jgi:type IV pilus assembly protein PilP
MTPSTAFTRLITAAALVAASAAASAQTPPAATGQAQEKPAQTTPPAPPPSEAYTYNPEGRRDPFVSLLFRGSDLQKREARPDGLPGLMINEISVRGIIRDRDGFVAMVAGPDNKTHIVHQDDKVFDGSVKAITADSVIFSQDVNDPLSLVKQREVRKYLRATQEGK